MKGLHLPGVLQCRCRGKLNHLFVHGNFYFFWSVLKYFVLENIYLRYHYNQGKVYFLDVYNSDEIQISSSDIQDSILAQNSLFTTSGWRYPEQYSLPDELLDQLVPSRHQSTRPLLPPLPLRKSFSHMSRMFEVLSFTTEFKPRGFLDQRRDGRLTARSETRWFSWNGAGCITIGPGCPLLHLTHTQASCKSDPLYMNYLNSNNGVQWKYDRLNPVDCVKGLRDERCLRSGKVTWPSHGFYCWL